MDFAFGNNVIGKSMFNLYLPNSYYVRLRHQLPMLQVKLKAHYYIKLALTIKSNFSKFVGEKLSFSEFFLYRNVSKSRNSGGGDHQQQRYKKMG